MEGIRVREMQKDRRLPDLEVTNTTGCGAGRLEGGGRGVAMERDRLGRRNQARGERCLL